MSENLIGNWDSVFVACHSWSREVRRLNKSRVHLLGWLNPKNPNRKKKTQCGYCIELIRIIRLSSFSGLYSSHHERSQCSNSSTLLAPNDTLLTIIFPSFRCVCFLYLGLTLFGFLLQGCPFFLSLSIFLFLVQPRFFFLPPILPYSFQTVGFLVFLYTGAHLHT